MATIEVDVVNFVLGTGTGTFAVATRAGFGTPKGIVVFSCGLVTADDTATAGVDACIGFSDGTNDCCTHWLALDGQGTTNTDRMQRNDACIVSMNTSGTVQHQMSVSAFNDAEVVFSIDNQAAAAYRCTMIVFGGTDTDYIEVGTTQLGTSGASTTVSLGGSRSTQPTLVLALGQMNASINTRTDHGMMTFGAAVNGGANAGIRYANQTGQTTSAMYGNVSALYATGQSFSAGNWNAAIDNWANDAFDINPDVSPGSDYVGWMSFQFTNSPGVKVGNVTYPGTSGDYNQTDVGFTPQAAIIAALSGIGTRDSDTTSGARLTAGSLVAFDDTHIGSITWNSDDGVTTSVEDTTHNDSFKLIAEDGTTTSLEGPTPTFDSAGWDSVLTTNPASDIFGFYIAFEANAAGGTAVPVFYHHHRMMQGA